MTAPAGTGGSSANFFGDEPLALTGYGQLAKATHVVGGDDVIVGAVPLTHAPETQRALGQQSAFAAQLALHIVAPQVYGQQLVQAPLPSQLPALQPAVAPHDRFGSLPATALAQPPVAVPP